jgi:RNA polymerase sigma-70 factor (ECF subfamily)
MRNSMSGKESRKKTVDYLRHQKFQKEMVPYMDMLYNYAYYLSNDREQANDLLQDTFLKAYRFSDSFESGTNAKAWLYRIMKNTYINEYRRHIVAEMWSSLKQVSIPDGRGAMAERTICALCRYADVR